MNKTVWSKMSLIVVVLMVMALVSVAFGADVYPSKPIRFIIPYPPGGSYDIIGRLIASRLSTQLGKQVVVDNRGGGGSIIGTEVVAKSPPDGYTLMLAAPTFISSHALQRPPYDPVKSFAPIARLGTGVFALVVHQSVPAKSVKELIALAKQKPGQLIFAGTGVGASLHLATELFKMRSGIDINIVQFKGAGPAMIDLVGGHSHAFFISPTTVLPHVKTGKVRVLATTGPKRSAFLPDLPTVAEEGLPGFEANAWWGILVPAGTPAPIVDRLSSEVKAMLSADAVNQWLKTEMAEPNYLGPSDFGKFIEREMVTCGELVKKANIKLQE